jgi:undecaprenyl-diphosphatase
MDALEALLLGFTQGVAEWLPISSSGHLTAAQILLGLEEPLLFDVALHTATLLVILTYFKSDLLQMASAALKLDFRSEQGRLIPLILLGSVPVAVVGFLFYDYYLALCDLRVLGLCFIASGLFVASSKLRRDRSTAVSAKKALIIGLAQALAILPGFSRSGLTISVALLAGVKREEAFRFSFLLSIPAVLGAFLLTLLKSSFDATLTQPLLLGGATAALVGYLSLSILRRLLMKGFFHIFGFYTIALGLLLLLL